MDKWSLFFGWVGLLSFVFAIPLAVIANLLTPRVQQWWALASQARRSLRLDVLKIYLAKIDEDVLYDNRFEHLVKGLFSLAFGLIILTYPVMLIGTMMFDAMSRLFEFKAVWPFAHVLPPSSRYHASMFLFDIFILSGELFLANALSHFRFASRSYYVKWRISVEKEIKQIVDNSH